MSEHLFRFLAVTSLLTCVTVTAKAQVGSVQLVTEEEDEAGQGYGELHGEYQLRGNFMSDVALPAEPAAGIGPALGQNLWVEQWLRLEVELGRREQFSFHFAADLLDGMILGDTTENVSSASQPRDDAAAFFGPDGYQFRAAYAQFVTSAGLVRVGLQPSHWGLGLLANDGSHAPPFGDYRYGNRNIRALFGTRPFGRQFPVNLVFALDLVYEDPIARLRDGERALQAIVAGLYKKTETRQVGFYIVYRDQRSPVVSDIPVAEDDTLRVGIFDVFSKWDWAQPGGDDNARIFGAFEVLGIFGRTTLTRSIYAPQAKVRQLMAAGQIGRRGTQLDVVLEAGYSSGDADTTDDVTTRARMHPDHRVGLLLFPEVLAWHAARAANIAGAPELSARPSPGSQLLPTDGGVTGAFYLFNWATYRPADWVDLRLGWIWARSATDVIDPYQQRARSRNVSLLGGDSRNRDLGLEIDLAANFNIALRRASVQLGVEGAILVPGRAFDSPSGDRASLMGMARLRVGVAF